MGRMLRLLALLLSLALVGTVAPASAEPTLPPEGVDVDYQLGGPYEPADNVGIVVRDRRAEPVEGRWNVCYVNAFQTQPDEKRFWRKHWALVLKRDGKPVVDSAWGEWLLDIRTAAKRRKLERIVGRWIDGCAAKGFDAVEFDNLDSFSRSRRTVRPAHAKKFARLLTARTHAAGLAAAQKNWANFDGRTVGFDMAVAEQCGRYDECDDYVAHYGSAVLAIEYRREDFDRTCAAYADTLPILLADRDLEVGGPREWC